MKETKIELCEIKETHKEILENIQNKMPSEDKIYDLAELFSVFGDSTRMRILFVLLDGEACVCDISECLGMSVSAISHQLRVLRQSDLVKSRREGKSIFYSLADAHVATIINQGMTHICEKD